MLGDYNPYNWSFRTDFTFSMSPWVKDYDGDLETDIRNFMTRKNDLYKFLTARTNELPEGSLKVTDAYEVHVYDKELCSGIERFLPENIVKYPYLANVKSDSVFAAIVKIQVKVTLRDIGLLSELRKEFYDRNTINKVLQEIWNHTPERGCPWKVTIDTADKLHPVKCDGGEHFYMTVNPPVVVATEERQTKDGKKIDYSILKRCAVCGNEILVAI